ncbi:UDP-glucose 4-epimerase GalE [Epibacterium sp. Ofav1-8]|uniref:UDP-glucose 4-epimerase GalE n=1 Tax=Epibacterium sp. Ofav1-8 TaxID=2917735 RepID=UPI001EF71F5A|nr:UDP-glucose 4-epimerase GalE [Epibacterium sp. Ofav1-8]MCG7623466.1 UDP-glucose 4-epimerase GalE [Epibacterium sp. Ofav1-8]
MSDRPAILVTGGAGFIGSHACKALAAAGYLPVAQDNLRTGHRRAVKWGPLEVADIRDRRALRDVLRRYRVRLVMHFAAAAYVGESMQKPGFYYDNNVCGTVALLAAMQDCGVGQIVFSSSCATYGIPTRQPIREDQPQAPINPYGRSKLICEQIIRDTAAATGLRFAMLRYFNACGADPEGELHERHDPETHLIPLALMAAAGTGPGLKVFGTDYDTPDGTCVRDYIHVSDLADAHVAATRWLLEGRQDLTVNLGTGHGHSILDILSAIERLSRRKPRWQAAPRRAGDPPVLVADPGLARARLGFVAQRSTLPTILRDAAASFGLEVRDDIPA